MSSSKLQPSEIARYSRQIILPQIGVEGQEKLKKARVLVIGAGGLGSPASLYLASAGVGTIGISDFDRVEEHNLHRQIVHDSENIGILKTESARARLTTLNPHLAVELHEEGVTPDQSLELFQQYDIIVDGTDNFGTRYLNSDSAFFAKKPLVYGSIFRFEGQVSLFDPANEGPCYRCLFPEPPAPGTVPNCAEAGVIGALCGIVGSLQAMEVVKYILQVGDSLNGRLLVIDTLGTQFQAIRIKKDPNCPLCSAAARIRSINAANYDHSCEFDESEVVADKGVTPIEIDVEETKETLEKEPDSILLDVREPFECGICQIEGSLAIPMREVPQKLDQLPRDKRILVYCHHGGRSRQVTEFLREQGFERVSNIAGGIDAWAVKFDPAMQRY